MPLVVELMKKECPICSLPVWAFFKSQEEFNNFKCLECETKDINKNDAI